MKRNIIILVIAILIVAAGAAIFKPWVFFQTTTVDEAFPFDDMTEAQQSAFQAMPDDMKTTITEMAQNDEMETEMVKETILAVMEPDTEVEEDPMDGMEAETAVLGRGEFGQIDPIHGAKGSATIYKLQDGQRIVRLEDFSSTNGPELHVILTTGTAQETFADVGDYVDLGILKGNMGNQNYEIPEDVDLESIRSVVIYCRPFHVVFSVADLETPSN